MQIEKLIISATEKGTIEGWIPEINGRIDLGLNPESIADFLSSHNIEQVSYSSSCEFATEEGEAWNYDTEPLYIFRKAWGLFLSRK